MTRRHTLTPCHHDLTGDYSMHPANGTRAERAQAALQSYVEAKGEVFENSSSEIADFIADLLHLAARLDEKGLALRAAINDLAAALDRDGKSAVWETSAPEGCQAFVLPEG